MSDTLITALCIWAFVSTLIALPVAGILAMAFDAPDHTIDWQWRWIRRAIATVAFCFLLPAALFYVGVEIGSNIYHCFKKLLKKK